ncbi:CopD family protein [Massilia solisilvae]|uniref:CopD family protein n=1 Tax=Massilia solisilvae TaxID=1811225 RepID=A0ABT2BHV3_9BURK|nr:CopD family protein [Massilia solisilvae]MCS0608095.1 CopD family protein [Massilia solisilvae]
MGVDIAILLKVVTVLLYLFAAVAAGANMAVFWLADARSPWALAQLPSLRRWAAGGALLALSASFAVLCAEAAEMAELPLSDAMPAVATMLASTHYGLAWSIGAGALAAAVVLPILLRARGGATLAFGALAVFWYSRSMVSHASGNGDASLAVMADWMHLVLVGLWLGAVVIAALVALANRRDVQETDRRERAAYVAALSACATIALVGIVITGLASAWHNLRSFHDLLGTPYGNALLAKLALVAVAVVLGGVNRFVVMPPWLLSEGAGRPVAATLPCRFRLVLQIETVILIAALVMAVILAATPPPGAAT